MHSWKQFFSVKNVFTTKSIVFMGLMTAATAVISIFNIDLAPTLRITLNYLPGVLTAMLYGPWAGLAIGFAGDLTGWMAHPSGPYFPGFALSAMVTNFIFALFLYKRDIKLWRVIAARLMSVALVDLGLNAGWLMLMYNKTAGEMLAVGRFIRSGIQFPIDIALIFLLGILISKKINKFF